LEEAWRDLPTRQVDYHRGMRKLVITLLLMLAIPTPARAEVGLGVFLGEPTGLDVKFDLQRRSALDLVLGWYGYQRYRHTGYGHLTYLYTPFVGAGSSIVVPLRIGIGGAFYGNENNTNVGVRVPLELGLRFRRTPLEIYGEIAVLITLINDNNYDDVDVQGGVGLRFYL
jgi:hypothetical protein